MLLVDMRVWYALTREMGRTGARWSMSMDYGLAEHLDNANVTCAVNRNGNGTVL